MKILTALAFAAALVATPALAKDKAAATADAVRAADTAFAARSVEVGFARAFREYADETDGLLYGMDGPPVKGADKIYEVLGGDAPSNTLVEWTVTGAWGAASGDLGVTAGDWKRTARDGSRPTRTGRYVTVWRKNDRGEWKALIDIGEADPLPPAPVPAATP